MNDQFLITWCKKYGQKSVNRSYKTIFIVRLIPWPSDQKMLSILNNMDYGSQFLSDPFLLTSLTASSFESQDKCSSSRKHLFKIFSGSAFPVRWRERERERLQESRLSAENTVFCVQAQDIYAGGWVLDWEEGKSAFSLFTS